MKCILFCFSALTAGAEDDLLPNIYISGCGFQTNSPQISIFPVDIADLEFTSYENNPTIM